MPPPEPSSIPPANSPAVSPRPHGPTAAIIGCGDISSVHADALDQLGIRVAGVCDLDADRAQALAERLGAPAFTDHRELLARTQPGVVHVCTPHAEHVPVALDVLAAGVHLLLEKPVADSPAQARTLCEAADSAAQEGIRSGVVYQNRYNPPNQRLHELITSGALGQVHGARAAVTWHRTAEYYAARPWRGSWAAAGGGVLMNQAIHTLDLLLWMLGPAITARGQAATHALAEVIEVEDTAEVLIRHEGGATSTLYATNAYPTNAPVSIQVHAEHATATVAGDLVVTWNDGRVETVSAQPPGRVGRAYWGDSHRLLIEDFYTRMDEPDPFWIGPRDGLATIAAIHQVYDASAALRGRVAPRRPAAEASR
ncbi:Gfo/Idh/MocA family protein [Ruania halotolerans]|uniref:Gfo/Idh/MocA family protein n=1 Tax=Ruania halotolerans TaxID=2897773 RepID=UPI001E52FD4D|nr:Gfo/Idh/MocA family oxidoreductase [Ruania halotolerans]UFU04963.1 Gfo/Idh/MocA family oxidoreductase [Ruania halotolerans]